ncbi:MAG: hypothetical protein LBI39_03160 [Puniceicoccales bacterium]|jgi:hypothetical protein|nr:hypothetical protein [Puniceicoccales bacterium]
MWEDQLYPLSSIGTGKNPFCNMSFHSIRNANGELMVDTCASIAAEMALFASDLQNDSYGDEHIANLVLCRLLFRREILLP